MLEGMEKVVPQKLNSWTFSDSANTSVQETALITPSTPKGLRVRTHGSHPEGLEVQGDQRYFGVAVGTDVGQQKRKDCQILMREVDTRKRATNLGPRSSVSAFTKGLKRVWGALDGMPLC